MLGLATDGAERFDRDGAHARAGRIVDAWLAEMLADPYLERPPPKSTGREHYGLAEARTWLDRARRESVDLDDLLATLTAASVQGVARAWSASAAGADRRTPRGSTSAAAAPATPS